MDEDAKKAALAKILMDRSGQNFAGGPSEAIIPNKAEDYKQMFENAGMSGAPTSSIPGVSGLYAPKDSMYQRGDNSKFADMGLSDAPQPKLNRVGGPLDVSPSGVAGELASNAVNPMTYAGMPGGKVGATVQAMKFPELSSMMKNSPEQASFVERQFAKDPNVRQVLSESPSLLSEAGPSQANNIDYSLQKKFNDNSLDKLKSDALNRGVQDEATEKLMTPQNSMQVLGASPAGNEPQSLFPKLKQRFQVGSHIFDANNAAEALKVKQALEQKGLTMPGRPLIKLSE